MVSGDAGSAAKTHRPGKRPGHHLARAVAISVSFISLWIVVSATGITEFKQGSNDISFSVDLAPQRNGPSSDSYLVKTILEQGLFVSVGLITQPTADVHSLLQHFFPTEREEDYHDMDGIALLTLELWQDRQHTRRVSELPDKDHRLGFLLVSNRAIQPNSTIDTQVKRLSLEEYWVSIDDSVFRPKFGDKTLTYAIMLKFERPLDGAKGLAQFEWRQSLDVAHSSRIPFEVHSYTRFPKRIDDVRTVAGINLQGDTSIRSISNLTTVGGTEPDTTTRDEYTPLEFSIHGSDSGKKDIVDFIVFAMAALFGAASSALFDSLVGVLERD